MKKCVVMMNNYFCLAGMVMLLAGCSSQLGADKTGGQSDTLRKNGNALIEQGDLKGAVVVFDKMIALDPKNSLGYNGKAVAFDNGGNHLAAQDIYESALQLSPDSVPIKNNLAMSLILNRQIDQAIVILEALLIEKVENPAFANIVRHNLAMAYGISGQPHKATALNLEDLSEEQARENIRFYENYMAKNAIMVKKR